MVRSSNMYLYKKRIVMNKILTLNILLSCIFVAPLLEAVVSTKNTAQCQPTRGGQVILFSTLVNAQAGNVQAALTKLTTENQHVIMYFFGTRCPFCKSFDTIFAEVA